jgi:hypothetical protein
VRTTLGALFDPCITPDTLKRSTDHENHAGIDISKDFARLKRCFRLSVSIPPSVLMNRFPMRKSPPFCISQWKVDFLFIYVQTEGITFVLDVSVHLHVDNHKLQSWHRRLLECRGRTSGIPGKAGFRDVKRASTFY